MSYYDDDPRIESHGNSIAMYTPYDAAFVDAFKAAVPYADRRFDRPNLRWIVAAKYGRQLRDLILDYFDINVSVPTIAIASETIAEPVEANVSDRAHRQHLEIAESLHHPPPGRLLRRQIDLVHHDDRRSAAAVHQCQVPLEPTLVEILRRCRDNGDFVEICANDLRNRFWTGGSAQQLR